MSSAREKILDAYEESLTTVGVAATTLDAVARIAGVSKGGLIYHFPSKEALADALIERFTGMARISADQLQGDAATTVRHFIEMSSSVGDELDTAWLAVMNLSRNGNQSATRAVLELERSWHDAILESTGSPLVAHMTKLLGDGLYHSTSFVSESRESLPEAAKLLPSDGEREAIIRTLLDLLEA
jgi:AcrR family transcriptional regulator